MADMPDITKAQATAYVAGAAGFIQVNFGYTVPDKWKLVASTAIVIAVTLGHFYSDLKIRAARNARVAVENAAVAATPLLLAAPSPLQPGDDTGHEHDQPGPTS